MLSCLSVVFTTGCLPSEPSDPNKPASIIDQKTQEIGEFKPDGDAKEADLQVENSLSPLASMKAYGYIVSTLTSQQIDQMVVMFEIENDRYPKDHEEFMREIIKKYNIQLAVLPGKRRYQYDVKNHKLVVVEAEK